ncbi:DUF6895 family protein [Streptomyces sp. SCSIO ZS0520]|uniref:DUF6895 family protein n=1 Tax=Streptomyces sp. SCSIO ZS0520 TaxID=2892996 RepID=UPI0021D8E234|nr:hypothetical protein [Streptomyces sp. SCSIO ZS0520]
MSGPGPGLLPDLDQLALRALSWARDRESDFRLPEDPTDPAHPRDRTLRPLAELAQLSHTIARVSEPGSRREVRARALFAFAWRETAEGEVLAALARREPFATYPLEMYAAFAEAGLRHPGFEHQVRRLTGTRQWRLAERDATRTLAVLHAERTLGLSPHRDQAAAQSATWLGGLAEPWSFTTQSGYAATHHVFHLTDWGTRPAGLPPEVREHLRLWLPAWLACTAEAGDWDLTGELLAVAAVLDEEPPGLAAAWHTLARAQRPDGALPHSRELAERAPGDFVHSYHATLVLALAASLTLHHRRRTREPAATLPASLLEAT